MYAWSPAALSLSQTSGLTRHELKPEDAVEHDSVVDYRRRPEEAAALRKVQAKFNAQLSEVIHKDELDRPPLLDFSGKPEKTKQKKRAF